MAARRDGSLRQRRCLSEQATVTAMARSEIPASVLDEIHARFATYLSAARPPAPGLAYGIVAGGELIHAGGLGTLETGVVRVPNARSVFRIASMTKSFTAATVLVLRDEGRLRLDDPIDRHVPELRGRRWGSADAHVPTLRDLLGMAGGLPYDDPWADRLEDQSSRDFTALLEQATGSSWTPGTAFEYANLGFAIVGRAVENVTGTPFVEVVSERILEPLGLMRTRFAGVGLDDVATGYHLVDEEWQAQPVTGPGAFSPIGGLWSSVEDIARWIAWLADAWPPRDAPDVGPLCRSSRRELQRPVTVLPSLLDRDHEGRLCATTAAYCLGLLSEADHVYGRALSHAGGYPGFGSNMRFHPGTGLGVVALANGRYAGPGATVRAALELLVTACPRRRAVPQPDPAVSGARARVARLLGGDDAALAGALAVNVEQDAPLTRRLAVVAELRARHGRLTDVGDLVVESPLNVRYTLRGARGGNVIVRLALTADAPPSIETLEFTSVADPPDDLAQLAAAVVAAIAGEGELPAAVSAVPAGLIAETAAVAAPCHLRGAIEGDGDGTATFLVESRVGEFALRLTRTADGRVDLALDPCVPRLWPQ